MPALFLSVFALFRAITCILHMAVSGSSIIALCVVPGKHNSVYGDDIADSIIILCGGIRRCGYYLKLAKSLWQ